jgi:hypothetical protein
MNSEEVETARKAAIRALTDALQAGDHTAALAYASVLEALLRI